VWINAHHKHDSNQVITTVMHVIADVKRRKGTLPPTLRIQADNCTRENKNVYMFALCAALVGLGYFQEVQLCFLIVGHTHKDIDQHFSIISNTLKRTNIDSLKELLQLVEIGTSYTEAFVSVRHLENVRDWKSFITPHLLTGGDTVTGITFLHHMRFYMESSVPRVQHKHFSTDAWGLADGHLCLTSLPSTMEKPNLAEVFPADERELRVLDDFIAYKKRCVERLQNVEKNLQAIDEIRWLKQYLEDFPRADRGTQKALPFWLHEQERNVMDESETGEVVHTEADSNRTSTEVGLIMATMPNPEAGGYFGPKRSRPSTASVTRAPRRRASTAAEQTVGASSGGGVPDRFPPFNPKSDIHVGQFVVFTMEHDELHAGVPFYVGKVVDFGQWTWVEKIKVMWYWPAMRAGVQTGSGCNTARYRNCMEASWKPSFERHRWVVKEAEIFSWEDVPTRTRGGLIHEDNVRVHGVLIERKIKIPAHEKPHLVEYIAVQMEAMDDERLQNDLNAY
jgi:hypothetical protein